MRSTFAFAAASLFLSCQRHNGFTGAAAAAAAEGALAFEGRRH